MKNMDIEAVIRNMADAGCGAGDIERVRMLHEAGFDEDIISCLRKCRCDLVEEMHRSQRRVDCMDRLIRSTESRIG